MSRIGKNPIVIPKGVDVKFDNSTLTVKGSKGELVQEIDSSIGMDLTDGVITFTRSTDMPEHRSKHGLYRALTQNMIIGVSEGFKKELEIVGVGYNFRSIEENAATEDVVSTLGIFVVSVDETSNIAETFSTNATFITAVSETVTAQDIENRRLLWEPIDTGTVEDWRLINTN
jgi:ribosomal protein L6P/L9E